MTPIILIVLPPKISNIANDEMERNGGIRVVLSSETDYIVLSHTEGRMISGTADQNLYYIYLYHHLIPHTKT